MEKNYNKSYELIRRMITLITKIQVNIEWSKQTPFKDLNEECYQNGLKEIKELSDLIVSLHYVESDS